MNIKTTKKTVTIQRYAATTRISDCQRSLWEWLRMNEDEVRYPYQNGNRYPMIGDIPHDVWVGTIGNKRIYAKSLDEVVKELDTIA
jgi:hypothetical protein